jgi:predicted dehydrogenase
MNPVRIAVAGAGVIGRRHIELIRESGSCELAAIVDPAPGAALLARECGVPLYPALAELFAASPPQAVIAATPNALHVQNGIECARHGVPVLIEKPIADSLTGAEQLIAAAERAGIAVLVGHHRRHSPILAKAREIVRQGRLGRLVAIIGSALYYKPDSYFSDGPWRREPGGGPILINMSHEVDDLRSVCGEIFAVQAFASSAVRGFPVEDTVTVGLRFGNGALGSFILSDTVAAARSWEQTSGENASYARYPDEDCYLISGVDGSLAVPTMRLKTVVGERSWWRPMREEIVAVERDDPLRLQLEHFCAVVRGEAKPLVEGRDALQTLRVTLAIAEAARTGRIVATTP